MPKESNPELRAQNKEPQNFRLVPETLRKIGDSGSGVWDKQNRLSGTGDKLKDRFKKDGIKWGFRVCVTSRLDARAPDECTFANLLDFVCDKFLHFSKTGTANVLGTEIGSAMFSSFRGGKWKFSVCLECPSYSVQRSGFFISLQQERLQRANPVDKRSIKTNLK